MKTPEEIRHLPNLIIAQTSEDGGYGVLFRLGKRFASVIWSDGGGWEHVSICPFKRSYMPSWDDMCQLKDMFFKENETVVQYHPAKSEYVNNMPNCLHLWRQTNGALPTPPSIMVGTKKGQSRAEIEAAIKEVCENEQIHRQHSETC